MPASLSALEEQQTADGGWGYFAGQAGQLEPTCLGLLALSLDSAACHDSLEHAWAFVDASSKAEGSYAIVRGRDQAIWPTALVLFVQVALGRGGDRPRRAASWLLESRGRTVDDPKMSEIHDFDANIPGWPWGRDNFSWVEPTAWAVIALRKAGLSNHPRVRDGIRLLLDRAHDSGGVNCGNRRIFGREMQPVPGPTALMLLATQGVGLDENDGLKIIEKNNENWPTRLHPRIEASLDYLQGQIEGNNLEHLCWIKIALDQYRGHGVDSAALDRMNELVVDAHARRADSSWARPAPGLEALTLLALDDKTRDYFRLPGNGELEPLPAASRRGRIAERFARLGAKIKGYVRNSMVTAANNMRPLPERAQVHVAEAKEYSDKLVDVLSGQFENFRARTPLAGKRVVLKPNLVEYHRERVINTHPLVVRAVIELCQREGAAEIIVAEGPGHWRNVEFLLEASGLAKVIRDLNVCFVDLNHDEPMRCSNLGGFTGLEHLFLARTAVEAEVLISLPKLKTHHWAGVTLSLKNLFGIVSGICYGWPKNELHWRGIERSIVDIALTRTPQLAIVDGIIGMDGDGPLNGEPNPLGALIMGNDLVAVDATCCRLMRIDPEQIGYLKLAEQGRLGHLKEEFIEVLGESIEDLARSFEPPPMLDHLSTQLAL